MSAMNITEALAKVREEVAAANEARQTQQTQIAEAANEAAQAANEQALQDAAAAQRKVDVAQAVIDLSFVVACADGKISQAETDKLRDGLSRVLGEAATPEQLDPLLQTAAQHFGELGQAGAIAGVAAAISDGVLRRSAFMVAMAASWLDRGIGVQEGLALQAISRAFDIPMNEMHQLLAEAKKA